MAIFFITSPAPIIHRVLPLIKEKKIKDLTIVTTPDLKPFFEKNVDAKVIVPKTHRNLITSKTKHKIFSNAIRSKLEFRRLFKNIENEEVYLFYTTWAIVHMSYVKKLSKKNKVFLYPEEYAFSIYDEKKGITALAMKILAKVLLSMDVRICDFCGSPVWELKKGSFPMEIVEYDKFGEKLPREFMVDINSLEGKSVLFLGGIFVSGYIENEERIVEVTDTVKEILDEKYHGSYVVKPHPREQILYGEMAKSENILSPHLLAETLMDHKWKYVIGYYSESLMSARSLTNATVISLILLFKWKDVKLKQYLYTQFKNKDVLMPKSIEELREMIQ